jgi:hypothetical protein
MITKISELEIQLASVDVLSVEFIEALNALERIVEGLKGLQSEKATGLLQGSSQLEINGIKIARVEVYSKTCDNLDKIDSKFVKVEKKLNIATVNEYLKEHRELPSGIYERKTSERISVKPIKEKKEFIKVVASSEALEFKNRFKSLVTVKELEEDNINF